MIATPHPDTILPTPTDRSGFDLLVYALVGSIPSGSVMTYGQIAELIPSPASIDPAAYRRVRARWVGYALGRCEDDLPWHRVVNAAGNPSVRASGGHMPQSALLLQEGVQLDEKGAVDLAACRWNPGPSELERIREQALARHGEGFID